MRQIEAYFSSSSLKTWNLNFDVGFLVSWADSLREVLRDVCAKHMEESERFLVQHESQNKTLKFSTAGGRSLSGKVVVVERKWWKVRLSRWVGRQVFSIKKCRREWRKQEPTIISTFDESLVAEIANYSFCPLFTSRHFAHGMDALLCNHATGFITHMSELDGVVRSNYKLACLSELTERWIIVSWFSKSNVYVLSWFS